MFVYTVLLCLVPCCAGFLLDDEAKFDVRTVRNYYLRAEKVDWDYLPQKRNLVSYFDE